MLFNTVVLSLVAFAATATANTNTRCVAPAKSCSTLPHASVTSCSKFFSTKGIKQSTCTVWKTVVPKPITKTIVVNPPQVTYVRAQSNTETIDTQVTEYESSTVTQYSTTVFLEEVPETTTYVETETFSESTTVTERSIIFNYGFALKKRATKKAPCPIPTPCSCLLTKTVTKTVNPAAKTLTVTRTNPRQTVTKVNSVTVKVTVVETLLSTVVDSTTIVESQSSTATITVPATIETSATVTETFQTTVFETVYTCVDPNRARCGNYCYRTKLDWYHCGGCNQRCNNGQICNNGQCVS